MSAQQRLAQGLQSMTPQIGRNELASGIFAVRDTTPTAVVPTVYTPALCLIAQGEKRIYLEDETYTYDEARLLLFAVDLPIMAQVTRAAPDAPYLGLRINLDPIVIASLIPKIFPNGVPDQVDTRGVYVTQTDTSIIETAARLVEAFAQHDKAKHLTPLIVEELMVRLLLSPFGSRVAQIGLRESHTQRISRAIDWILSHYDQPMQIGDLAAMVHMSNSSFHQHFKSITTMTPLQYQKVLRLQHARQLMLSTNLDATHAAAHVGYASVSQFSREYRRLFGEAPMRDVARMRHTTH